MSAYNRPAPAKHRGKPTGNPLDNGDWTTDIKAYYDSVAHEPVPDSIQDLMAALIKAKRD